MMIAFQDDTATALTPEEYSLAIENEKVADEMNQLVSRLTELMRRLDVNCGKGTMLSPSWPPRTKVASAFCTGGAAQQVAVAS